MKMHARIISIVLATLLALAVGQELISKESANEEEQTELDDEGSGEIATKRGEQKLFPNIGYLFKGYNIIKGNPMDPDKFDPGFAGSIFKSEFTRGMKTADMSYEIPDNTDVIGKTSCRSLITVKRIMTKREYQHDLHAKASVSGSAKIKVVDASFTASTEYRRVSKELESNEQTFIKNEASCVIYEGRILTATPPAITDNFREFVKKLAKNEKKYYEFLDTFGTHFVEKVDMGARYTKLDEMSKQDVEELQKNDFALNHAAEASILGIGSVSSSIGVELNTEDLRKYKEKLRSTKVITVGSTLPENGDKNKWAADSIESPMPVFYTLTSIVNLFDGHYFTIDGVDLSDIQEQLLDALQGYCKVLKERHFDDAECEGPPKGCGGGSQCSINAECKNNHGNETHPYDCVCKQGYQGDGKFCQRDMIGVPTGEIAQLDNRFDFGDWGVMEVCPNGAYAMGFALKSAVYEGIGDDTGANAICIYCDETVEACSEKGLWGDWSKPYHCPKGSYLAGWRQNVLANQGGGMVYDDTGLNNVEYECRDLETWERTGELMAEGHNWGTWSLYRRCPRGQFICGVKTRVAPFYYDDTALNDITHECCKPKFSAKKMARMLAMQKKKRKARKAKKMRKMRKIRAKIATKY